MSTYKPVFLSLESLENIIRQAKDLQAQADKSWTVAVQACAVEILYRKQTTLLSRFVALCREETVFPHVVRALIILTGGSALVKRNGKALIEYAPSSSVIRWNTEAESFDYDAKAHPEAYYKGLRADYEASWMTLGIKQIRALDPPKKLTVDTFRKTFERYAENESLWAAEDRDAIKSILFALNGIGGIPRRADIDMICASQTSDITGEPQGAPNIN